MQGDDKQGGMDRREFITNIARGAAYLSLAHVLPTQAMAQQQQNSRELITPREFLELLEEPIRTGNTRAFYDIQRRYEIYGRGADYAADIGIQDENGRHFRDVRVNFNIDNLARIPAAPGRGFPLTAQPTHSFLKVLHEELYRINPNDPRPPRPADSLNFEWRSRAQAREQNANIPETWDELGNHFVRRHGVVMADLQNAIRGAVMEVRSLSLDGRRASLDIDDHGMHPSGIDFG